jgi:hypothetical protein
MHVKKPLYYVVGAMAAILATNASAQVTTSSPGAQPNPNGPGIDFQNAKPLPLPQAGQAAPTGLDALRNAVTSGQVFGSPGFSPGGAGTGEKNPVQLAPATKSLELAPKNGVTPEEFGTSNLVYTTSRAPGRMPMVILQRITTHFVPQASCSSRLAQRTTSVLHPLFNQVLS